MDKEGLGNCTITGSYEAVCPKEISLSVIAKMNRDYGVAILKGRPSYPACAGWIRKAVAANVRWRQHSAVS